VVAGGGNASVAGASRAPPTVSGASVDGDAGASERLRSAVCRTRLAARVLRSPARPDTGPLFGQEKRFPQQIPALIVSGRSE
jgi:hypothetical protein